MKSVYTLPANFGHTFALYFHSCGKVSLFSKRYFYESTSIPTPQTVPEHTYDT